MYRHILGIPWVGTRGTLDNNRELENSRTGTLYKLSKRSGFYSEPDH